MLRFQDIPPLFFSLQSLYISFNNFFPDDPLMLRKEETINDDSVEKYIADNIEDTDEITVDVDIQEDIKIDINELEIRSVSSEYITPMNKITKGTNISCFLFTKLPLFGPHLARLERRPSRVSNLNKQP